jgi:hypothetical protein
VLFSNTIMHRMAALHFACTQPYSFCDHAAAAATHAAASAADCSCCVLLLLVLFQIAVLANHQNGRDTHMRQVLVYGPAGVAAPGVGDAGTFESSEFNIYSTMR